MPLFNTTCCNPPNNKVSIHRSILNFTTFGPGVCYDVPQSRMAEQFAFFKDGLSDLAFVRYMELVQEEVERYFTKEWGDGTGEADLLQSLSNVFTLTSSRCLLGEEIRKRWDESGMAEHYCTYCIVFHYGLGMIHNFYLLLLDSFSPLCSFHHRSCP